MDLIKYNDFLEKCNTIYQKRILPNNVDTIIKEILEYIGADLDSCKAIDDPKILPFRNRLDLLLTTIKKHFPSYN